MYISPDLIAVWKTSDRQSYLKTSTLQLLFLYFVTKIHCLNPVTSESKSLVVQAFATH